MLVFEVERMEKVYFADLTATLISRFILAKFYDKDFFKKPYGLFALLTLFCFNSY